MRLLFSSLLAVFFTAPLFAQPISGFSFSHKDWEVSCDNTGTCRAAGYGVKNGEISVLLTRKAGPRQQVHAVATFAQIEDSIPDKARVNLFISDQDRGELIAQDKEHFRFNSAQTAALIQALTNDKKIEIALNGKRKALSSAGANATFLKVDEFQRRIGTKNALLRKGTASDAEVLQASPAPIIIAAPVIPSAKEIPLTPAQRKHLEPKLTAQTADCDYRDTAEDSSITLTPLNKTHSVLMEICWTAAYNMGYAVWVVDNELATTPQLITTEATSYANGKITFVSKGRGIADCLSGDEWVWDGKAFVHSLAYSTGGCREILPGGTWMLPTLVTEVKTYQSKEKGSNSQ